MTKQSWYVEINRADSANYCGLVKCSPEKIILEVQTLKGIAPRVELKKMEESEGKL